eukprot:TRINITY_DN6458_c0_g1_i1.p1 TRINITY_DN6458_c0_g1~~TRINITY_DN6458_c0_g1_i1.p1  ORF type:complete len:194 (-),score=33.77 TRINITY_DN6458_c0_g1_i1:92-673(-)
MDPIHHPTQTTIGQQACSANPIATTNVTTSQTTTTTSAGEAAVGGRALRVTVVSCNNLKDMDVGGRGHTDPYVELQLGGQAHRTKVVQDQLNPIFNDEFVFSGLDHPEELSLKVIVRDEDAKSRDEGLGYCTVELDDLVDNKAQEVTKSIGRHGLTLQKATVSLILTPINWHQPTAVPTVTTVRPIVAGPVVL